MTAAQEPFRAPCTALKKHDMSDLAPPCPVLALFPFQTNKQSKSPPLFLLVLRECGNDPKKTTQLVVAFWGPKPRFIPFLIPYLVPNITSKF